ncbi:MAG: PQQ-binding-like beta-propeller repeat protein [Planctomycetes bacterium]|nr:PQQ-binding-like beta-propeller repeat protein [Planctomycetota bacterium]
MMRYVWSMVLAVAGFASLVSAETNWPRWRGPAGTGHTDAKLPVEWGREAVRWQVELPGVGQSSPVVWEDRIFLTSASDDGLTRMVFCLSRDNGALLWKQEIAASSAEPLHKMNTFASATCATDGEVVAAFFGRGGLHAFTLDGKKLWSRDFGAFEGPWGTGASPVIVDNLVIQNCDADNAAYLVAVDKWTGETVWRTPRDVFRGWSTPVLVEVNGAPQLIMNGHTGIAAYDPVTGEQCWLAPGDRGRGTPTVAPYQDLVIAVGGRPGDMWAVRPAECSGEKIDEVWRTKRIGGRDLPSPIVVGDTLFVVSMQGVASSYEAATGKLLSRARLGGNFSASPIAAGGKIYLPSEEGEILVIEAGDQINVIARNPVDAGNDEIFRASLAVHRGQLLCRSDRRLYCIGSRP